MDHYKVEVDALERAERHDKSHAAITTASRARSSHAGAKRPGQKGTKERFKNQSPEGAAHDGARESCWLYRHGRRRDTQVRAGPRGPSSRRGPLDWKRVVVGAVRLSDSPGGIIGASGSPNKYRMSPRIVPTGPGPPSPRPPAGPRNPFGLCASAATAGWAGGSVRPDAARAPRYKASVMAWTGSWK